MSSIQPNVTGSNLSNVVPDLTNVDRKNFNEIYDLFDKHLNEKDVNKDNDLELLKSIYSKCLLYSPNSHIVQEINGLYQQAYIGLNELAKQYFKGDGVNKDKNKALEIWDFIAEYMAKDS